MTLGDYLHQLHQKIQDGSDPEDGCVQCGRKHVLLHPVGRAWACSNCHTPPNTDDTSAVPAVTPIR